MEKPSSTFDSDFPVARQRLPWGLIGALALLVAFEIGSRIVHPDGTIPYSTVAGTRRAILTAVRAFGAAEISFVGSSRVEIGILTPFVRTLLKNKLGQDVEVRNYGMPCALPAEIDYVVKRLLESENPPSLIMYGITSRQLTNVKYKHVERTAQLRLLGDWWEEYDKLGDRAFKALPAAIRLSVLAHYRTYRYRHPAFDILNSTRKRRKFLKPIKNSFVFRNISTTPIGGGLAPTLRNKWRKNMSMKVPEPRVIRFIGNKYTDPDWPWTYQTRKLESILKRCREAGVAIVLYEEPTPRILRENLPVDTRQEYQSTIFKLTKRNDVRFFGPKHLGLVGKLHKKHFREQSHLNHMGAKLLSRRLVEKVIAPFLSGEL